MILHTAENPSAQRTESRGDTIGVHWNREAGEGAKTESTAALCSVLKLLVAY